MATKFSPCKGSYVLNQFPSNVMFGMNGFHVSASGAIQGHHGPLVVEPACGEQDIVVTMTLRCNCMHLSVRICPDCTFYNCGWIST